MRSTLDSLWLVALCLFLAPGAWAQTSNAEKRADTLKLMELLDIRKVTSQMIPAVVAQVTESVKRARPGVPQRALDALGEEMIAVFDDNFSSFAEMMVLVYDRHFSADEIKQLAEFYATPLGRKLAEKQGPLASDGFRAGSEWGKLLAPEVDRRMRARLAKEGVAL